MTLLHLKRKSISSISLILLALLACSSKQIPEQTVVFDHPEISSVLRIAVPAAVIAGSAFILINDQLRGYALEKWTKITSPNHMAPDQFTAFHFTPWEEEKNQDTQCDKGVHFTYSYLPVIPLAYTMDRAYSLTTSGRINSKPANFFVAASAGIVLGFGLMEELQDGKQVGEGFDVFDMTANISGIILALAHYYGHLDFLTVFWSFNKTMYRNDDFSDRWPWWVYMAGYEFSLNINVLKLLTKYDNTNKIYNSIVRRAGYLPELRYLENFTSIY